MKKVMASIVCVAALVGSSAMANANLIKNGSFEGGQQAAFVTLDANGDTGNVSIAGWTVYGSIDWINNYWQNSQGANSLDLAGYYQHGMVVSDPFQTTAGVKYRVTFDMAGNPDANYDKSLWAVDLNDPDPDPTHGIHPFTFLQAGRTRTDMGWKSHYFDFIAAGPTSQLAFLDVTESPLGDINAFGAALDNVDVSPVPEPSSIFLLGAGLAGFAMLRRKLRKE